eukprot:1887523-Rhodomonas_salina.2
MMFHIPGPPPQKLAPPLLRRPSPRAAAAPRAACAPPHHTANLTSLRAKNFALVTVIRISDSSNQVIRGEEVGR